MCNFQVILGPVKGLVELEGFMRALWNRRHQVYSDKRKKKLICSNFLPFYSQNRGRFHDPSTGDFFQSWHKIEFREPERLIETFLKPSLKALSKRIKKLRFCCICLPFCSQTMARFW